MLKYSDFKKLKFPRLSFILGFGGLIPFVFCAVIIIFDINFLFDPTKILLYYGSVILSFVGAISWGFATMGQTGNKLQQYMFLCSIFPALIAFVALLISQTISFLFLILGFLLAYMVEKKIEYKLDIPSWYMYLRLRLTLIVSICLCVGLIQDMF